MELLLEIYLAIDATSLIWQNVN